MTYQLITHTIAICPDNTNPVYGEGVTRIELADNAGGFFFEVVQVTDHGEQRLRLDPRELELLAHAGVKLMSQSGVKNG